MALIDDVNQAITSAMKSQDQARLGTLRMLKAALVNRQIEKGKDLDAAESIQVVMALVKQRHDSIDQFKKGGRTDLADKEAAEIRVLEGYLPPALDPAELDAIIAAAIFEAGATSARDLGKVMKAAMSRLAGSGVDGKVVNEAVRKKLGG